MVRWMAEGERALRQVEQLRNRHQQIARELMGGEALVTIQSQIDAMIDELRDLVKSIAILGELTNRSLDTFASFGEKLSTLLLTNALKQAGTNAVLVNAQEVMVTNADFTRAVPIFEEIDRRAPRRDWRAGPIRARRGDAGISGGNAVRGTNHDRSGRL